MNIFNSLTTHINNRLNVFEKKGYYPIDPHGINSFATQENLSVSVIYYPDKLVISGSYGWIKLISIKANREKNKVTLFTLGILSRETKQQLKNRLKCIALLPDKWV